MFSVKNYNANVINAKSLILLAANLDQPEVIADIEKQMVNGGIPVVKSSVVETRGMLECYKKGSLKHRDAVVVKIEKTHPKIKEAYLVKIIGLDIPDNHVLTPIYGVIKHNAKPDSYKGLIGFKLMSPEEFLETTILSSRVKEFVEEVCIKECPLAATAASIAGEDLPIARGCTPSRLIADDAPYAKHIHQGEVKEDGVQVDSGIEG